MSKQSDQENIFLAGEADAWYERNKSALNAKSTETDPIFKYLSANSELIKGKKVLEVGCSNGYRLAWLKDKLGCTVFGFDPSPKALEAGAKQFGLKQPAELFPMTSGANFWAKDLREKFGAGSIDCIIFGHSLYLMSPTVLPQIVATTDYLLKTGGLISIFDFDSTTQRRRYHHTPDAEVYSYKMDYASMFNWIPYYRLVHKNVTEHNMSPSIGNPHEDCALSVLRKVPLENAYPQLT